MTYSKDSGEPRELAALQAELREVQRAIQRAGLEAAENPEAGGEGTWIPINEHFAAIREETLERLFARRDELENEIRRLAARDP